MIEININECIRQWKILWRYCAEKGLDIPYILTQQDIPTEYKYTAEEINDLLKNIDPETLNNIKWKYITRRRKEIEIVNQYNDLDKAEKKLMEYHENELQKFIKENKQFQKLIL